MVLHLHNALWWFGIYTILINTCILMHVEQPDYKHAEWENTIALLWPHSQKNKHGRQLIFRGVMAVEGLAHQPAYGLPTDGHTVRPGPRVNIICILNHSEWESLSLCSHFTHPQGALGAFWTYSVRCTDKLKSYPNSSWKNFPQGALWFSNPVVNTLAVMHTLLKPITRR